MAQHWTFFFKATTEGSAPSSATARRNSGETRVEGHTAAWRSGELSRSGSKRLSMIIHEAILLEKQEKDHDDENDDDDDEEEEEEDDDDDDDDGQGLEGARGPRWRWESYWLLAEILHRTDPFCRINTRKDLGRNGVYYCCYTMMIRNSTSLSGCQTISKVEIEINSSMGFLRK